MRQVIDQFGEYTKLNKKLGDDAKNPRFIRTVRGVGYSLQDPSDDS